MVDLEELGGISSDDVSWTITYDRIVLPAPAKEYAYQHAGCSNEALSGVQTHSV